MDIGGKIDMGSVFRGLGVGAVSKRALDPQSINAILKQRAEMAGLEPGGRSWAAIQISDGGCEPRRSPPRSNGAIAPSFSPASFQLLHNVSRRSGRAARLL